MGEKNKGASGLAYFTIEKDKSIQAKDQLENFFSSEIYKRNNEYL